MDPSLPTNLLRLVDQARDKGASSWLNTIPLEEQGLVLNKQEFRDSLSGLPSHCACGDFFNTNYLSWYPRPAYNSSCKNVESEPHLLPLDNELLDLRSENSRPEARLNIKAGSF